MKATLDRSDGEMEPAARSEDHTGPGRHESYQSPWRTTWAWQGKGGGGQLMKTLRQEQWSWWRKVKKKLRPLWRERKATDSR